MKTKVVSFRLTSSLLDQLDYLAEISKNSRSSIITHAITTLLEKELGCIKDNKPSPDVRTVYRYGTSIK